MGDDRCRTLFGWVWSITMPAPHGRGMRGGGPAAKSTDSDGRVAVTRTPVLERPGKRALGRRRKQVRGRCQVSGGNPKSVPEQSGDVSSSTHFVFENKVFAIAGAYFSLTPDKSHAVFNVPLGATMGAVPLRTLRSTFDIPADGPDEQLLAVVENSLRYVKVIRPGESIPRELLDGTASWSVDDRHRSIANGRLALQLASWISGNEVVVSDFSQLEQVLEDPQTQARINEAYQQLSERLGAGAGKDDDVRKMIDAFAHELAYIEALRDRFGSVKGIAGSLSKLQQIYRTDRSISNDVIQMGKLLRKPIVEIDGIFLQVDAQSGEILSLLRTFDAQVAFTRKMRDELHWKLMDWDDMLEAWCGAVLERNPKVETLLKDTYRFLAQRFLSTTVWGR